jgi:hypothetical protein
MVTDGAGLANDQEKFGNWRSWRVSRLDGLQNATFASHPGSAGLGPGQFQIDIPSIAPQPQWELPIEHSK